MSNKIIKKNGHKKISFKLIASFVICEIVIAVIAAPLIIFYGPFKNLKKTIVGSAMATYKHQYIATMFLSQKQINEILDKHTVSPKKSNAKQDLSMVKVENSGTSNKITSFTISTTRFDAYVLEISDPTKVRAAMTSSLGVQGERTSEMAKKNGAIAAIDGGSFLDKSKDGKLYAGTGSSPQGFVIIDGKVVFDDKSDMTDELKGMCAIAFDKNGKLIIGSHTVDELLKMNVTQAMTFRMPLLVINGKGQVKGDGGDGMSPRTAIGQKADGTVIFAVADGRQGVKWGATLKEMQDIMLKHGAVTAAELDGGSSTTLYYDGEVINTPSDWDGERSIATAIYALP